MFLREVLDVATDSGQLVPGPEGPCFEGATPRPLQKGEPLAGLSVAAQRCREP